MAATLASRVDGLAFVALPFDYAENALSLFLLSQYQDGQVFPTLARVAGIATAAKFLGLGCMGLTMGALFLRTVTKFIVQKVGSLRGARPAIRSGDETRPLRIAMLLVMACGAAFVAGLVDAVAGGGGLIQLPALLVIFPDTPVPLLLGTNKVASVSGTVSALARYVGRVAIPWRVVVPAAVAAFFGSFLGARLVAWLPTAWMRPTVIFLLAGVALFTFLHRDFGSKAVAEVRHPVPATVAMGAVLMGAVLGLYDGFFGPGTGSFLLFGFVMLLGLDFLGASASAKVVNVATNLAAILAFAWAGHVWWDVALPMAACNVAGSQVGSRLALARGAPFVRQLFLTVVLLLLGRMTWEWLA